MQLERNKNIVRQMQTGLIYHNIRTALTGKRDSAYSNGIHPLPTIGLPAGYIWVREGEDGERAETAALIGRIRSDISNIPVRIGELVKDGKLVAIEPDINERTVAQYGGSLAAVGIPNQPVEWQRTIIEGLYLNVGRVRPSTLNPDTLYVYIAPFMHNGRWYGGIDHDIGVANVPASSGQMRWVMVVIDDDNVPSTVAATARAYSDIDTYPVRDTGYGVETITVPAGSIPVGGCTLVYGQTAVKNSRFIDPRYWLAQRGTLLSEDAETLTLSSDAVTAGSGSFFVLAAQTGTTDDCKTITVTGPPRIIVIQADSGDTITIKHNGSGGNIKLNGAVDYALSGDETLALFWDGVNLSDLGITGGASPLTTRGDLFYYTTDDARLPIGLDQQHPGYVDANVAWIYPTAPASFIDPTTTDGDLIYRSVDTVTALGVLFIGDSITESYGIPTDTATNLSVNGLTVTAYNEGVSGTSTDDWAISSSNDTTAYATFTGNDIRVVSISLGVNDARVAVRNDADTFQASLQAIVNGWVNRGAVVFIHFPTYCVPGSNSGDQDATANSLRIEYQARILQIVNGTTIRLGDTTGYAMFANDTSLLTDGIHPTAGGADKLAAAWARGMQTGVSQMTQVTTLQRLTLGDGLTITGSAPAVLSATATPSPSSDGADHLHGLARWVADGSDTTFDLPDIAEYVEMVFDDGSAVDQLTITLSDDGAQIVFDSAPGASSIIQVQYVIASV